MGLIGHCPQCGRDLTSAGPCPTPGCLPAPFGFTGDAGEVERLRQQLAGAVSAWRKYATHLPDCAVRRDPRLRLDACTCGLTALSTTGGQ